MKEKWLLTAAVIPLSLLALVAGGCGGSGGDSDNPQPIASASPVAAATTRVTATVEWPARTRNIAAPGSAESVLLLLRGARPDGSDFAFVLERGANDDAFTQSYTSPDVARVGDWDTEVRCLAAPGGVGDLVALATLRARLGSDGRPLDAPLALRGAIASLVVVPGQEVGVGEHKELRFTARNEKGEILAIPPRAAVFTVTEGAENLRVLEGRVGEGARAGEARVTVRVDGITSAPETVRVVSRVAVSVRPERVTLSAGAGETFQATVTGTDNTGVDWSIREGAPGGGTITDGGRYTAPLTPGEYHVVATSKADPTKSAVAVVIVTAPAGDATRRVELPTNDLAWDPVSRRIWASVPGRAGGDRANSITALDPTTGQIGDSFPIGPEPDKLALLGASQLLWVGVDGEAALRRFSLANKTASPFYSLGDDEHGRFLAEDIAVMPERPEVVAVARRSREAAPRHEGVVLYNNGTPRERQTDRHQGSTSLAFSALPGKLYGYNGEPGGDFGFRRMEIGETGVQVVSNTTELLSGVNAEIAFDDNRLYSPTGKVIRPETREVLGTFPNVGEGALVLPDSGRGVVYFLSGDGDTRVLRVFDRNTYAQIADRAVAGVHGKASSLIRWGESGLAFRTNENQVFLLRDVPAR